MKALLPFVITGIATGSLYGVAAMGLVLTYKTSGIFNFAHGAVAAGSAYIFFELHTRMGLPWPMAAAIVMLVAAPAAGILMERIARGLADAPPATKIVATVGLLLAVQGTATAIFGSTALFYPQFLPKRSFEFGGVIVGADQIIMMALAALSAGGLYVFFQSSRLGVAMRGVVDNAELLDLTGTNPNRVRTQAWVIGTVFAAASGILLAPTIGLDAFLLTLVVIQAFGAAAVGRFSSLPLTYLGGILIGVGAAISTKYVAEIPTLAGFPSSLPFIVLFGVLLMTKRGTFLEGATRPHVVDHRHALPGWLPRSGRILGVGIAVLVPLVAGARLPVFTNAVIYVLIFLSLRLLVRTSGQISLCHAAFAAVGASTFAHLSSGVGLPWPVALVAAALATAPLGALVAIPAIRLSGLYLALATLGFGVLVERLVFPTALMFGGTGTRHAGRPALSGLNLASDKGYYGVCLAIVLAVALGMYWLNRSRLGLLLQAMADSPVALAAHGVSVTVTRVLVFCISASMAGLAGALFGGLSGSISGVGFGAFQSLTWLAILVIAGTGEFSAAALAAISLAVIPAYIHFAFYANWQPVIFGGLAVVAALAQGRRSSIAKRIGQLAERHVDRVRYSPVADRLPGPTLSGGRVPTVVGSEATMGGLL
jgi:branched-subunit amino acid ABC-type transport system permease component